MRYILPFFLLFQITWAQSVSDFGLGVFEIKPLGSSTQIRMGRTAEIAKFRIENRSKRRLELESIRLKNYGSANLTKSFENWVLSHNGAVLRGKAVAQNKYIEIQLESPLLIARGDSLVLSIKARLIYAKTNSPTVTLGLRRQEDIALRDVSSGFQLACNDCEGVRFKTHTLRPGGIYITRQSYYRGSYRRAARYNYRRSSPIRQAAPQVKKSYNPGAKDVLFFQTYLGGKTGFQAEGVFLEMSGGSFAQDKNNDGQSNTLADFNGTFKNFKLVVNGQSEDFVSGFETENGRMGLVFDQAFSIPPQTLLQVYGRIDNRAVKGDKVRFRLNSTGLRDLTYRYNQKPVSAQNINGSRLSPSLGISDSSLKISK